MKTLTQIIKERIKNKPLEIFQLETDYNINIEEFDKWTVRFNLGFHTLVSFHDSVSDYFDATERIDMALPTEKNSISFIKQTDKCRNFTIESGEFINFKRVDSVLRDILSALDIKMKTHKLGKTILLDRLSLT